MARQDTPRTIAQVAAELRARHEQPQRAPRYADDLTEEEWAANDAEHASLDAYARAVRL